MNLLYLIIITAFSISYQQFLEYSQEYFQIQFIEKFARPLFPDFVFPSLKSNKFTTGQFTENDEYENYCQQSLYGVYDKDKRTCTAPSKEDDCKNYFTSVDQLTSFSTNICVAICYEVGLVQEQNSCRQASERECKLNFLANKPYFKQQQKFCSSSCDYPFVGKNEAEEPKICLTIKQSECSQKFVSDKFYDEAICTQDCALISLSKNEYNQCSDAQSYCQDYYLLKNISGFKHNLCLNKDQCNSLGFISQKNISEKNCQKANNQEECQQSYINYFDEENQLCLTSKQAEENDELICDSNTKICTKATEQQKCKTSGGTWYQSVSESYCYQFCRDSDKYWDIEKSQCIEGRECQNKINPNLKVCNFQECQGGYYPEDHDQKEYCNACLANCDVCDNSETCSKCKSGYKLGNNKGACFKNTCDIENCQQCTENNLQCQTCKLGFGLTEQKTCKQCGQGCTSCQDNHSKCVECENDYKLIQNECIQKQECLLSHCKECSSNNQECNICDENYGFTANRLCQECSANCLTCSDDVQICTSCKENYGLNSNNQCSSCLTSGCDSCFLDYTKCQNCMSGYMFNETDNNCLQCSMTNCGICYLDKLNECSECQENYVAVKDEKNKITKCISKQEHACNNLQSEESMQSYAKIEKLDNLIDRMNSFSFNCESSAYFQNNTISSNITNQLVTQLEKLVIFNDTKKDSNTQILHIIKNLIDNPNYNNSNSDNKNTIINVVAKNMSLNSAGIKAQVQIINKLVRNDEDIKKYSPQIKATTKNVKDQFSQTDDKIFNETGTAVDIWIKQDKVNEIFNTDENDEFSEENGIIFSKQSKQAIKELGNSSSKLMFMKQISKQPFDSQQLTNEAFSKFLSYDLYKVYETGEKEQINLKDLTDPLKIEIPFIEENMTISTSKGNYIPHFWDTDKATWSTTGVKLISLNETTSQMTFSTTHLTEFIILQKKLDSEYDGGSDRISTTKLILLILFILLALILIIITSYFSYKYYKNKEKSKKGLKVNQNLGEIHVKSIH